MGVRGFPLSVICFLLLDGPYMCVGVYLTVSWRAVVGGRVCLPRAWAAGERKRESSGAGRAGKTSLHSPTPRRGPREKNAAAAPHTQPFTPHAHHGAPPPAHTLPSPLATHHHHVPCPGLCRACSCSCNRPGPAGRRAAAAQPLRRLAARQPWPVHPAALWRGRGPAPGAGGSGKRKRGMRPREQKKRRASLQLVSLTRPPPTHTALASSTNPRHLGRYRWRLDRAVYRLQARGRARRGPGGRARPADPDLLGLGGPGQPGGRAADRFRRRSLGGSE